MFVFRASLVLLPPPAGAARRSATYLVDAFPFEGGALQACVRLLMTPARSGRARAWAIIGGARPGDAPSSTSKPGLKQKRGAEAACRLYFFFYFSTETSNSVSSSTASSKASDFSSSRGLMEEAAEAPLCDVPVLHTGELVASDAAATAH